MVVAYAFCHQLADTDVDSMKKTTTRLATVAVVIVMGAFAIALAQHDSRQRGREPELENGFANEQATPLAVTGEWSADLPDLPNTASTPARSPAELTSRQLPTLDSENLTSLPSQQRWKLDAPELASEKSESSVADDRLLPAHFSLSDAGDAPENELRSAAQAMFDSGTTDESLPEYPESQVVTASAEDPASLPQLPPAWLGDAASPQSDVGTGDEIPQLPATAAPPLPSFPLSSPASPSPSSPSPADATNALPEPPQSSGYSQSPYNQSPYNQSPGNTAGVSLGTPQLPTAIPSAAAPNAARGQGGSPSFGLSDTQRGAMAPTDVSSRSAGAHATGGTAAASPSSGYTTPAATAPKMSMASLPTSTSSSSLVSDLPGNRYLDGSQNPILLIQKRAPEEIQVGKAATFVITVRNAGNSTAHDVTVLDAIPRGMQFADSNPPTNPSAERVLTWQLGEMAAGDERTLSVQLIPEVEGEVGSTAIVSFATQASVRTVATQPRVEVRLEATPEVLIGSVHQVQVTIANTGTGIARNVRLEADIPQQLRHESGEALLDASIGDLRPNESKRIQLTTSAIAAGMAECIVRAVDEDGVQAEQRASLQVKAPQLVAAIEGPARRYLERQATYRIAVQNTGTAAATNLDFVIHLPSGLKFISTDIPQSTFDPKTNTVSLGLFELAPGKTAPIALTVLPVEMGSQAIKLNASADLAVSTEAISQVQVDGLAELAFTIGQDNGTVEVGASTTYSVQISNVGNQTDRQVQLIAQLPSGAELLGVDAPVDYRVEGANIIFSPLTELKSKDQHTYRFQVRHNTAGNQVVRTQLTSANWPVPVVKEEGTLVYNDK